MRRKPMHILSFVAILLILGIDTASGVTVFDDSFGSGVGYEAFEFSDFTALSIDSTEAYLGSASLKVTLPDPGTGFAGGAFLESQPLDLTGYNAVTFWVKSSQSSTLEVAGLGNPNALGRYQASRESIPLTTSWSRVVIPIPLPAKLTAERGLFYYAKGSEGADHKVWFDEIKFENLASISAPRPSMPTVIREAFLGETLTAEGTMVTFDVDGTDYIVLHEPAYFTFFSSNSAVVTVNDEILEGVGPGTASITAKLGDVDVAGTLTLNVTGTPAVPAPDPVIPAQEVISLFSDSYDDVPVDTWSTTWDLADVTDITIAGNAAKAYSNFVFAGITFESNTIDASQLLFFLMDAWIPVDATFFRIKLVDFGADNQFGGGDDSESELTFSAVSNPPLATGSWQRFEIPLADFVHLASVQNLAQLLISGNSDIVFVDNVMFANHGSVTVKATTWGGLKRRYR